MRPVKSSGPEVVQELIKNLRGKGLSMEEIALGIKTGTQSVYRWMRKGAPYRRIVDMETLLNAPRIPLHPPETLSDIAKIEMTQDDAEFLLTVIKELGKPVNLGTVAQLITIRKASPP